MAQRLLIVAHAATPTSLAVVFGQPRGPLSGEIRRLSGRVASWSSGPEEVCEATALCLGGHPERIPELRECDFGAWTGRALTDIASDRAVRRATRWRESRGVDHSGGSRA
jgi:broad specificity phosphatase PhoE